ncbi:MAG: Rieske (2Fe-2S) protein [Pyrinomonadaceae bacterium]
MPPLDSSSDNPATPASEERASAVTVGRAEDVPPGRSAVVELSGGKELALFNINNEFYAVENFCPHRGAPLAEGRVCDYAVECNWHNWRFDVRTGKCLSNNTAVESYQVVIEDGWIKINM